MKIKDGLLISAFVVTVIGVIAFSLLSNRQLVSESLAVKNKTLPTAAGSKAEDAKENDLSILLGKMGMSKNMDVAQAPDFTLLDVNEKTISLNQFRGDVVLLGFWTTW